MKRAFAVLLGLFTLAGAAWACRYSVRDTGFVDLGEENYQLVLAGKGLGERADLYRRIAAASLIDANITLRIREDSDAGEPSLTLVAPDGRTLLLARGDGLPSDSSGAASLVESVALSPLRAEIHEAALNSFAVVVLLEGGPPDENARAQASIEAAIAQVALLMPSMPKPVDAPPVVIRAPVARQAGERVTAWGLGFDPAPANEPRAALIFGRGRRIGSPLEGPLITQTVVQERLAIIGQDCECELDRAWMKGPLLPARWDAGRQKRALRNLGFDPENPMVRAEVSRIVLRGPGTGRVKKLAAADSGLGYSEVTLDELSEKKDLEPEASDEAGDETPAPEPPLAASAVEPPKADPLEGPLWFAWFILSGGSLAAVVFAGLWWRKIRREQG